MLLFKISDTLIKTTDQASMPIFYSTFLECEPYFVRVWSRQRVFNNAEQNIIIFVIQGDTQRRKIIAMKKPPSTQEMNRISYFLDNHAGKSFSAKSDAASTGVCSLLVGVLSDVNLHFKVHRYSALIQYGRFHIMAIR